MRFRCLTASRHSWQALVHIFTVSHCGRNSTDGRHCGTRCHANAQLRIAGYNSRWNPDAASNRAKDEASTAVAEAYRQVTPRLAYAIRRQRRGRPGCCLRDQRRYDQHARKHRLVIAHQWKSAGHSGEGHGRQACTGATSLARKYGLPSL